VRQKCQKTESMTPLADAVIRIDKLTCSQWEEEGSRGPQGVDDVMGWGLRSKHPLAGYVLGGPCDETAALCRSDTADTPRYSRHVLRPSPRGALLSFWPGSLAATAAKALRDIRLSSREAPALDARTLCMSPGAQRAAGNSAGCAHSKTCRMVNSESRTQTPWSRACGISSVR
jgi:hypothetical protein